MGGARGGVQGVPATDVLEASDLPKLRELMVKQTNRNFSIFPLAVNVSFFFSGMVNVA